jgi:hypothetical protein
MGDKRLIVLFVEGETEEVFYKYLLDHWRQIGGLSIIETKIINLHGIGNYAKKSVSKYKGEICRDYPNCKHEIFLAYDTDVFELAQKPPVDWVKVEKELKTSGAVSVTHLKAEKMIEDWLIFDLDGICSALKIKKPGKLDAISGHEKMKKLFKNANRVYQKGFSMKDFIPKLSMQKITTGVYTTLSCLKDSLYPKE